MEPTADYLKWATTFAHSLASLTLQLGFKIRVLGTHTPLRGSPVPRWAYRAEAVDETDAQKAPAWSCTHMHETPHLAQSCGLAWLAMERSEEQPAG